MSPETQPDYSLNVQNTPVQPELSRTIFRRFWLSVWLKGSWQAAHFWVKRLVDDQEAVVVYQLVFHAIWEDSHVVYICSTWYQKIVTCYRCSTWFEKMVTCYRFFCQRDLRKWLRVIDVPRDLRWSRVIDKLFRTTLWLSMLNKDISARYTRHRATQREITTSIYVPVDTLDSSYVHAGNMTLEDINTYINVNYIVFYCI